MEQCATIYLLSVLPVFFFLYIHKVLFSRGVSFQRPVSLGIYTPDPLSSREL